MPPSTPPWMFVQTTNSGTSHNSRRSGERPASTSVSIATVTAMPDDGDQVRADVEVRRPGRQRQPDDGDRARPGAARSAGADAPATRTPPRRSSPRDASRRVEPADPVGEGHADLAEPLVRHPPRAGEGERVRVGVDEPVGQDLSRRWWCARTCRGRGRSSTARRPAAAARSRGTRQPRARRSAAGSCRHRRAVGRCGVGPCGPSRRTRTQHSSAGDPDEPERVTSATFSTSSRGSPTSVAPADVPSRTRRRSTRRRRESGGAVRPAGHGSSSTMSNGHAP